jgi:hypothetical protein
VHVAALSLGAIAGGGYVVGAIITATWAPDLLFQVGFGVSPLIAVAFSAVLFGLGGAALGVVAAAIRKLLPTKR